MPLLLMKSYRIYKSSHSVQEIPQQIKKLVFIQAKKLFLDIAAIIFVLIPALFVPIWNFFFCHFTKISGARSFCSYHYLNQSFELILSVATAAYLLFIANLLLRRPLSFWKQACEGAIVLELVSYCYILTIFHVRSLWVKGKKMMKPSFSKIQQLNAEDIGNLILIMLLGSALAICNHTCRREIISIFQHFFIFFFCSRGLEIG